MGDSDRTNVIVVGAGASREFNLPTGAELASIIERDLNFRSDQFGQLVGAPGDMELRRAIGVLAQQTGESTATYINSARQISRNMALTPSIDNYLDTHRNDANLVNVGKLAIANAIIKAERRSTLYIDEANTYNRLNFSKTT